MARDVRIAILGDSKDFSRAVKNASADADRLDKSLGRAGGGLSKFSGIAKAAAIGVAGLGVVGFAVGKGLVDAATEAQKVGKQTEAVLASMGPAAGVTAKHVADLSERLSEQAGIDDELIQSGQNVLLTFGKVQNKIGKGNKIFDRATEAALNMSVALGTDMQGATIQVGKALNDPIKGITALSRAGVSFTQKQKDTIKSLVETGDTLGAQKIILGELEKQFGGSAAAQATAGDRLRVVWGNLQEDLGMRLLPMFETFANFLSRNLPPALDAAGRFLGPLVEQIGNFKDALFTGFTEDEGTPIESVALAIRDAAIAVADWFSANGETIKTVAGDVFGSIAGVITTIKDALEVAIPKIAEFGQWFLDEGPGVQVIVAGLAAAMGTYAHAAVVAAAGTLIAIGPWILAALALGTLAWAFGKLSGEIHLFENMGKILDKFDFILEGFIDTARDVVDIVIEIVDKVKWLIENAAKIPFVPGGSGEGYLPNEVPIFGPMFDDGGVMPGPRGKHSLAWVAGGETILPTHKSGFSGDGGGSGGVQIVINGDVTEGRLRELIYQQKKLQAIRLGAAA